jgi:UDP-glucose 6-dehydrogenase
VNVVIQGYGAIGSATAELLDSLGHRVSLHDPARGHRAEPAEVCVVATPCADGFLDDAEWACRSDRVVVRSTVVPAAFDVLTPGARYHWPEFSCEQTVREEIAKPDKLVWGADSPDGFCERFLRGHYHALDDRVVLTTLRASAIVKLGINAHYVAKLAMFNALYDAVARDDCDYDDIVEALGLDQRITVSHAEPWHGGYRGAGGKCLAKDTTNLAAISEGWAAEFLTAVLGANSALLARP